MGYRSDITIITNIEGYNYILRRMSDFEIFCQVTGIGATDYPILNYTDSFYVNPIDDYVIVEFRSIKWYDFTDDYVKVTMNILSEMRDIGLPVSYAEIGEDDGDIKAWSEGWDENYRMIIPETYIIRDIGIDGRKLHNENCNHEGIDFLFITPVDDMVHLFIVDVDEKEMSPMEKLMHDIKQKALEMNTCPTTQM